MLAERNLAEKIGKLGFDVFSRRSVQGAIFAAFTAASASLVTKTPVHELLNASVSFFDAITIASTSFTGFVGFMFGVAGISHLLDKPFGARVTADIERMIKSSRVCWLHIEVLLHGTHVDSAPDLVAFGHEGDGHLVLHGDHLYSVSNKRKLIKRLSLSENEIASDLIAKLKADGSI